MPRKPLTDEQREAARERQRRYNAKPEVVARRAEYYRRPEVQARYKQRNGSGEWKAYCKAYRQTQKGAMSQKEASLRNSTDGAFSLKLWQTLMQLQGNACALCRRPFDSNPRLVHADHCHDTQRPRGLLCQHCNHAEGQIRKTGLSPEEFGRRLQAYLGNPPAARAVAASPVQDDPAERNCHVLG